MEKMQRYKVAGFCMGLRQKTLKNLGDTLRNEF
jgi:hypothetical protein